MKDSRGRPDVRGMKSHARRGTGAGADRTGQARPAPARVVYTYHYAEDFEADRRRAEEERRAAEERRWRRELEQRREGDRSAAEAFIRRHGGDGVPLRQAFRRAALKLHPDTGGDRAQWDQLDRAARLMGLL